MQEYLGKKTFHKLTHAHMTRFDFGKVLLAYVVENISLFDVYIISFFEILRNLSTIKNIL